MVSDDTVGLIKARLILAQKLLEESDRLKGYAGYNRDQDKWWLHPRHEREAVVVYLLLTCFDLLGQDHNGGFVTFEGWLNGKKPKYIQEKNLALKDIPLDAIDHVGVAKALHSHYQNLYGIKNNFFQGILNLEPDIKNRMLKSVRIIFSPDADKYGPDTSPPGYELDDKEHELRLKLKRIFGKRNNFTHNLEQYYAASFPVPTLPTFRIDDVNSVDGSSWGATITDGRLYYLSGHYEFESHSDGSRYQYDFSDWPFVLFEILYAAINIPFDRTDINLKFYVRIWGDGYVCTPHGIPHKLLKPLLNYVNSLDDLGVGLEDAINKWIQLQSC